MSDSYKHSYKVGEDLLNSLSVYNVGYQKCEPEYQWGPGVRDHYCIHHILSGRGYYSAGDTTCCLTAGDTFIIYPGAEVKYYADREEPWEYAWAGFMGTDAASIIRNTDFTKEKPYIRSGRIPGGEIRSGIEKIYSAKGNTYEATVAMAGALYSLLAVFIHYCDKEEKEKGYCVVCRNQPQPPFPVLSDIYGKIAQGISVGVQDQAGVPPLKGNRALRVYHRLFCRL